MSAPPIAQFDHDVHIARLAGFVPGAGTENADADDAVFLCEVIFHEAKLGQDFIPGQWFHW